MVEESGTAPYCYDSTFCRMDGFTNLSATIYPGILKRMGISNIGLKCYLASMTKV